jgi:hypothetical protein
MRDGMRSGNIHATNMRQMIGNLGLYLIGYHNPGTSPLSMQLSVGCDTMLSEAFDRRRPQQTETRRRRRMMPKTWLMLAKHRLNWTWLMRLAAYACVGLGEKPKRSYKAVLILRCENVWRHQMRIASAPISINTASSYLEPLIAQSDQRYLPCKAKNESPRGRRGWVIGEMMSEESMTRHSLDGER